VQLSRREIESIFKKLRLEPKKSTHHLAGWLVVDGKRILPLHYSHSRKDMPGNVPHRFRKSMLLTGPEFNDMKACTMSREAYIELLRGRGLI